MQPIEIVALAQDEGLRLDAWIARALPELTRTAGQRLIAEGAVTLNGKTPKKNDRPRAGDVLRILLPEPETLSVLPEDIPLDVVYEDEDLIVVNKPKGMVVHPAPGNTGGTLVNALLYHCGGSLSGINGVIRPGIVHRIDKMTGGLLVAAKNDAAHLSLAEQIGSHTVTRAYRAVTVGRFREPEGAIDLPLGRSPKDRKKQAVNGLNPRPAVTHYELMRAYRGFGLYRFRLETGRTHQIRVHAAYLGHPIAGDDVYGDPKHTFGLQGQCLFAETLGFRHPRTGEEMLFTAPLPGWFTDFLDRLQEE